MSQTIDDKMLDKGPPDKKAFGGKTATLEEEKHDQIMQMSLSQLENTRPAAPPVKYNGKQLLTLDSLLDVPIQLTFEVGRTRITIRELLELNRGSFVELRNVSVDSIDVRVNGEVIGHGEAIALKQRYGVRFGEVEVPPTMGIDDAAQK